MRHFASLRSRGDFARLRARGRRYATEHLMFFRAPAGASDSRPLVGFSISKEVGGAVVRNLVRRRLSAALQASLTEEDRVRLLIVARPGAAHASYDTLYEQVRRAIA